MPGSARDVAAAAEYLLKRQRKGLEAAAARPLIDIHRKREKLQRLVGNLRAIYLLVGEVPPPADRLRQEQPHDDTVRRTEKIDFFEITDQKNADCAAEYSADNRKPALAYGFHRKPVL